MNILQKYIFTSFLLIFLSFTNVVFSQRGRNNIEIVEDFKTDFEYFLEKSSQKWVSRGFIEFSTKNRNKKDYRENILAKTGEYSTEEKEKIKQECMKNGLIFARVKINNNYLLSSAKAV